MKWPFHPLVVIVITLFTGLFVFSLFPAWRKTRMSTETVDVLEQEISKISSDVFRLEKQTTEAGTSFAKEKMIRDQLLMQKPGEYVVQIPDLPTEDGLIVPSPSPQPWQEWRELVF